MVSGVVHIGDFAVKLFNGSSIFIIVGMVMMSSFASYVKAADLEDYLDEYKKRQDKETLLRFGRSNDFDDQPQRTLLRSVIFIYQTV